MQALQKGNCKKKTYTLLGFAVSDWNKSNQRAKGKATFYCQSHWLYFTGGFGFCLVCGYTYQSTAMVIWKGSVNLTTLSWASLAKLLTSTACTYFR